jgi:hypothetical protein
MRTPFTTDDGFCSSLDQTSESLPIKNIAQVYVVLFVISSRSCHNPARQGLFKG